jgi:hypothetical protein
MTELYSAETMADGGIEELCRQIEQKENLRKALSELRAVIKEKALYEEIRRRLKEGEVIAPLLLSEDAKIRKNAAALLGDLQIQEMALQLYLAYQKEETLFVRGTILGALEKTDPYPYLSELQEQYEFLCKKEIPEHEKKHTREEIRILERILRKEGKENRHTFTGWEEKLLILLTTNGGYQNLITEKLSADRKKETSLGVQAVVNDLRKVTAIRTFRELLFPVRLDRTVVFEDGPEIFGEALANSKLLPLLERCHKEPAPFYFRIDLRGGFSLEERSRYIKRAAFAIEEKSGRRLINTPEDYEFEIRLLLDKTKKIHVFLKMFTIPMERFSYRKGTIAASMHPSMAAMILELARPWMKEKAQ